MGIRKLVVVAVLWFASAPAVARAEVGIGIFVGEPTGLDVKLDLARRSALDIVLGVYSHYNRFNDGSGYAHLTYLVQPFVSYGDGIIVPLRVGIGVAVFDDYGRYDDDINVAARVPFELGLRFRNTPLEIYFEIAVKMTFIDADPNDHPFLDLDGGVGLRFYL
jgi:hypothetical protein